MSRLLTVVFLLLAVQLSAARIENFIDSKLSHQNVEELDVDAIFVLDFSSKIRSDSLKKQLGANGIPFSSVHAFLTPNLSSQAIASFCSQNISPYLLGQILSHLSVYRYSLDRKLGKVLVIEHTGIVAGALTEIRQALKKLNRLDPGWDILFTDLDMHDPKNGERLAPHVAAGGKRQPNKIRVNNSLSRVKRRYGTVAYVISRKGMRKLYKHLTSKWANLPLDQAFFKLPNVRYYCLNRDVITNAYEEKIHNPISYVDDEILVERPDFTVGDEFWIEPEKLLVNARFDVMAKYLYARSKLNGYETDWHEKLYREHIGKWNNFYEGEPLKIGFDGFRDSFDQLIASLSKKGFEQHFEPVPINSRGVIVNGSHRVGTCLALGIPVRVKVAYQTMSLKRPIFSETMRMSHHVEEKYLDCMAYEYAKLKENTYIVCLFPPAFQNRDVAEKVLKKYGDIVYSKDIYLNKSGSLEFIREIYRGEGWVGNQNNNFRQGRVKAGLCFPDATFGQQPMRVYLYECSDLKRVREVKESIRRLLQLGHDSVHINDDHEQTVRVAATVFNRNSLQFIKKRRQVSLPTFDRLFASFPDYLQKNGLDQENLCIDASAILSAYGLRDCRDFDLLHRGRIPSDFDHLIDSHNGYLKYHATGLDDILYNPDSHFYYGGIKFLNIDLLRKMKLNRGEEKDYRDVALIDSL